MKARIYWLKNLNHSYTPRAVIDGIDIKCQRNDIIDSKGSCHCEGRIDGSPERLHGTSLKANGQVILSSEISTMDMIFIPEKVV